MARRERDAQRSKVYQWEFDTFRDDLEKRNTPDFLTLSECRALAADLYGKQVVVKDGRGRRNACAYDRRLPTIALPTWARTPWVIAHEVAHLNMNLIDRDLPGHGSLFMRENVRLLARVGVDTERALWQSAKDYGLKVTRL